MTVSDGATLVQRAPQDVTFSSLNIYFFVTLSTSAIKLRLLAFQQHRAQVRQQELSETRYENRANRGEL